MLRRVYKDLLVTAFGAITSALIAWLLALADTSLHFPIAAFSINFIPVGAIFCGVLAETGNLVGFRIFPHHLTWLLLINTIFLAIATNFLIFYLDYSMLVIREGPISHFISFGTFLKSSIENRGLSINLL